MGGQPALMGYKESFEYRAESDGVTVLSEAPWIDVHQKGTKGKGGSLPTIVPKKAKALFVPLTKAARESKTFSGQKAVYIRRGYGVEKMTGRIRMATGGRKYQRSQGLPMPLKVGRIKDGELQVRSNEGEWVREAANAYAEKQAARKRQEGSAA